MATFFGGGQKDKKVAPPQEDRAALAEAEARRKAQQRKGFQSTFLSQAYNSAVGKMKTGQ